MNYCTLELVEIDMRTYWIFIFFASAIFLTVQPIKAQEKVYDQYVRGNKAGELKVTYMEGCSNSLFEILVESKVKVSLLVMNATIEYTATSTYRDGVLQEEYIEVFRNGDPHSKGHTVRDGDCYIVTIDGKNSEIDQSEIPFSSLLLYIKEPVNVDEIYSGLDGIFNPLKYKGDGVYMLNIKRSRNNYYHYENGVLVKAKLDHWIAPVTLRLRD
ncbi:MAG: hypothetical protein EA411_08060 [Saprospirales bacterium]|nr:MAG: hypothetical protein EA411_08060 [Saprospirales bacterium]